MKQFNLEEYLKDPSRKVATKDGRSARIICTDRLGAFPVIALVKSDKAETVLFYTNTGCIYPEVPSEYDLFFAPEKHERWVNLYKSESGEYSLGAICICKEHAEVMAGRECIATVKIEWDE